MRSIIEEACETFGIRVKDLMSESRKRELFHARVMIAVKMKREKFTFHQIGNAINRDHSTVVYYLKTFEDWRRLKQAPDKLKPLCYE